MPSRFRWELLQCPLFHRARVSHLHHGGVLDRVSVRDDAAPVDDKPRARRLFLLQPLPRQRPARKVVGAVDLRRRGVAARCDGTRAERAGGGSRSRTRTEHIRERQRSHTQEVVVLRASTLTRSAGRKGQQSAEAKLGSTRRCAAAYGQAPKERAGADSKRSKTRPNSAHGKGRGPNGSRYMS